MDKGGYKPRFLIIILVAVIIGQYILTNSLRKDFDDRITQCYDAINASSIMQGALVNILVDKEILQRKLLLEEVKKLSIDLQKMVEKMEKSGTKSQEPEQDENWDR